MTLVWFYFMALGVACFSMKAEASVPRELWGALFIGMALLTIEIKRRLP
jgi:hypothetical protein